MGLAAAGAILRVQQERDVGHEGSNNTGHVHLRDLVGLKLFLVLLGQVLLKGLAEVERRAHFLRVALERKKRQLRARPKDKSSLLSSSQFLPHSVYLGRLGSYMPGV